MIRALPGPPHHGIAMVHHPSAKGEPSLKDIGGHRLGEAYSLSLMSQVTDGTF